MPGVAGPGTITTAGAESGEDLIDEVPMVDWIAKDQQKGQGSTLRSCFFTFDASSSVYLQQCTYKTVLGLSSLLYLNTS